jgi:hypothetical protein
MDAGKYIPLFSTENATLAAAIPFSKPMHFVSPAFARTLDTTGIITAAKTNMMTMTTRISVRVKAAREIFRQARDLDFLDNVEIIVTMLCVQVGQEN